MADLREAVRRPPHAPMPRRSRKRWAVAAGIAGCWALLLAVTGSVFGGTALLLLLAALGAACVLSMRSMGIDAGHPWVKQLATRPWRDGQDVLRLSLRRLSEVFVTSPTGSLLAPNSVELRLSPRDFGSLSELMDIGMISSGAAEVYEEQVAAHDARFVSPGPAEVRVISDPSVPAGRYGLRPVRLPHSGPQPAPQLDPRLGPQLGPQLDPGLGPQPDPRPVWHEPGGSFRYAHEGGTRAEAVVAPAVVAGLPTVAELRSPPIPVLKLITGDAVTQTRTSGARAGRGAVDLVLPEVPTVSREHATFTFADGQWWIANLGRNGLTLNGTPLVGGHAVRDGDSIRWGKKPEALVSRVEIG